MSAENLDELYKVLEVSRNADENEIKKSYRKLVLKWHPDKNPDDREAAQHKIRAINAAYETLGNLAKRNAYEAQAAAMAAAKNRPGRAVEFSTAAHRRVDVSLPKIFMMCPMGYPDKFLRGMDRELAFQSRSDVKTVGFEEFFAGSKFSISWLPNMDNPDRLPKFNQPCMLQKLPNPIPSALPVFDNGPPCTPGWVSFGLSPGVPSSDIMVATNQSEMYSTVLLQESPDYPNAFRFESHYFPGHYLAFNPPTIAEMTGVKDQFTIVDFVVVNLQASAQHMALDEVLVPAVLSLGGDCKHVDLTAVCMDHRIRAYFQATMGSRVWDFSDFEIYFHAHYETWDYNHVTQAVRWRPQELREKKEAKQSSAKKPKVSPAAPNRDPTRVVLLTNLVGPGDVDEDLEEETADEAKKYGKLTSCKIKEMSGVPDDEAVRIFLEFEAVESSKKAFADMNGRFFDGRSVKARYYNDEWFKQGQLEKNDGW